MMVRFPLVIRQFLQQPLQELSRLAVFPGQIVRRYRRRLLMSIVLGFIASSVSLLVPWAAGQFAERLFAEETAASLAAVTALLVLLLGVQSAISYVNSLIQARAAHRILLETKEALYDQLQRLPIGVTRARARGDLMSLFDNDAYVLTNFITGTLVRLPAQLLLILGAVLMMALMDPVVALVAVAFLPGFVIATRLMSRSIRPISERMYRFHGESVALLEENLLQLPLIKTQAKERDELDRLRRVHDEVFDANMSQLRVMMAFGPLTQFTGAVVVVVALGLASTLRDGMTIGETVTLLFYGLMMYRPVGALAGVFGALQATLAAVDRVMPLMNAPAEIAASGAPLVLAGPPRVTIDQLDFRYGKGPPVLAKFSLEVAPGELILLAGPNGVGKSTIASLVARLIEPPVGTIFIDGLDITGFELASYRRSIGFAYQGIGLFDRTIRENLGYGLDADVDVEVIADTGLLDFVQRLENGLDTPVGPGGSRLSGGQRGRIALARLLLQRPRVMIIDEATSMLDAASMDQVARYVESLEGTTRIIIEHSLNKWSSGFRIVRMT